MRGADWACVDYMLHVAQRSFRKNGDARKVVSLRPVRSVREVGVSPAVK